MITALDETAVLGLTTNVGFLRALVAGSEFATATIDTCWLDTATVPPPDPALALVVAAWLDAQVGRRAGGAGPFRRDGWRIGGQRAPWRVVLDDHPLLVEEAAVWHGERRFAVQEQGFAPLADTPTGYEAVVLVDGERLRVVADVGVAAIEIVLRGHRHVLRRPAVGERPAETGDGAVAAPMPGTVLEVRCTVGESVVADQVLVLLEAMKMEMSIRAPFDGVVARVAVVVGDQPALGALLVEIEAADAGATGEEA